MPKPNGTVVDFTLVRPQSWILTCLVHSRFDPNADENDTEGDSLRDAIEEIAASDWTARAEDGVALPAAFEEMLVGSTVDIDLAEFGAEGPAEIVSVGPCPEFEAGGPPQHDAAGRLLHRRLVTGTFRHTAASTVELSVEGEPEPLRTTSNHLFWSADRNAFVPAESLCAGDNLLTREGRKARVSGLLPRPGPETVYNLEIDGEHTYHVGASGVLVHNKYPKKTTKPSERNKFRNGKNTSENAKELRKNMKENPVKSGEEAHHVAASGHTHPAAVDTRRMMKEHGVDINDAANGVGLTHSKHHGKGLHSHAGIKEVNRRIKNRIRDAKAGGENVRDAIRDELRTMGQEMARGEFHIPQA